MKHKSQVFYTPPQQILDLIDELEYLQARLESIQEKEINAQGWGDCYESWVALLSLRKQITTEVGEQAPHPSHNDFGVNEFRYDWSCAYRAGWPSCDRFHRERSTGEISHVFGIRNMDRRLLKNFPRPHPRCSPA